MIMRREFEPSDNSKKICALIARKLERKKEKIIIVEF